MSPYVPVAVERSLHHAVIPVLSEAESVITTGL